MDEESLKRNFGSMGARLEFRSSSTWNTWRGITTFTIDVRSDKQGEYFEITQSEFAPEFDVLQVMPKARHLLLYARDGQRFLCGYDELHWFVAQIEGKVSSIRAAKQSLLPREIREQAKDLPKSDLDKRKNRAFRRQGEWFFVPTDHPVPEDSVRRDEHITWGGSSHLCEELYSKSGEQVYVVGGDTYTTEEYTARKKQEPDFDRGGVEMRVKDAEVFVRGYVKHRDHRTVVLRGWHQVFHSGELRSPHVVFLD